MNGQLWTKSRECRFPNLGAKWHYWDTNRTLFLLCFRFLEPYIPVLSELQEVGSFLWERWENHNFSLGTFPSCFFSVRKPVVVFKTYFWFCHQNLEKSGKIKLFSRIVWALLISLGMTPGTSVLVRNFQNLLVQCSLTSYLSYSLFSPGVVISSIWGLFIYVRYVLCHWTTSPA